MYLYVKKSIIKNKRLIMILVLLILFYFWKVPFAHEINKTITALQVNGQDKTISEVDMTIKGTYSTYIFGEDKFKGNIIIDGFESTNESYRVNISIVLDKLEVLEYIKINDSGIETNKFGVILADNNFKTFAIIPFKEYLANPSYVGSGGSIEMDESLLTAICYPATTRDEGMEIVNKMVGKTFNNSKKER